MLGPSPHIQKALQKVGLNIGWNEKYQVYITTSHNGWEQAYNMGEHVQIMQQQFPRNSILQPDKWDGFCDYKNVQRKLLDVCVLPIKTPAFESGGTQWEDLALQHMIKLRNNALKELIYASNRDFAVDCQNHNGNPIVHTDTGMCVYT